MVTHVNLPALITIDLAQFTLNILNIPFSALLLAVENLMFSHIILSSDGSIRESTAVWGANNGGRRAIHATGGSET